MLIKKTIIYRQGTPSIPQDNFWQEEFLRHFNLAAFDSNNSYNKEECVFWVSYLDEDRTWYRPYADNGFKIIHDYLYDHSGTSSVIDNTLILKSNHFIIAHEILWYRSLKYNTIDLGRVEKPEHFLLCLMHLTRDHRDQIYPRICPYTESLISYVSKGIHIAGDCDTNDGVWQRFANANWYRNTNFSLVVETSVIDPKFISEKSVKPYAFKHPFITWGPPRIHSVFKNLGFESFSHIIDESYNTIENNNDRLDALLEQVSLLYKEFKQGNSLFTDTLSKEIIDHNYNLFYSKQLAYTVILFEIMNPILEFINA